MNSLKFSFGNLFFSIVSLSFVNMEGSKLQNVAADVISFFLRRQQEYLAYPNARRPIS
jgi:hypothetical protein